MDATLKPDPEKRIFGAICALLDAQGICELLDAAQLMDDAEFPNTIRAATVTIQRQIGEALRILEGEEA